MVLRSSVTRICVLEAGTVGHFWDRNYKSNVFNNFCVPGIVPAVPALCVGRRDIGTGDSSFPHVENKKAPTLNRSGPHRSVLFTLLER